MANVGKIEAVMDYILTHPEEHDQSKWAAKSEGCGTTMCFAGTAVMLAGHRLMWEECRLDPNGFFADYCVLPSEHPCVSWWGDGFAPIADIAAYELELNWEERHALFHDSKSLDDLERVVKDIANGQVA